MGERENDTKGKDNGPNSQQPEFKGAPNAAEAFSGWFDNWKPWTTIGWGIKNSIEKTFGEGAAEQGEFENLKIRLVNMASKVIGILKESLGAETQKNGEEILVKEKGLGKDDESESLSGRVPTGKSAVGAAEMGGSSGRGITGSAKGPIVSTDISATIAKASARAAGPAGGIALISDKGPGIQMPDITKGGR